MPDAPGQAALMGPAPLAAKRRLLLVLALGGVVLSVVVVVGIAFGLPLLAGTRRARRG